MTLCPSVEAQSSNTLVSNIDKTQTNFGALTGNVRAQKFTTGSSAFGYTLTSIEAVADRTITSANNLLVQVCGVAADGRPNLSNIIANLNVPSRTLAAGNVVFSAPANTTLDPNTSYFLVLINRTGTNGPTSGTISYTTSNDEQGATGWSIANSGYRINRRVSGSWTSITPKIRMRVNGTATSGKVYAISSSATTVEGVGAQLDVTLGENAPAGGLTLNVAYDYTNGSAVRGDLGALVFNRVVVPPGSKTTKLIIRTKSDNLVEGDETFQVKLSTSASGWREASTGAGTATVTIADDDADLAKIAFGTNAQATTNYTRAVSEDLSSGSLNVPLTISHLPQTSTTFNIEVLSTSTATENTDYRIGTKSVTFGPTSNKTQQLTVNLINDALGENAETIELRVAAADDPVNDLGDHYTRNANSSKATITINSEDVPHALTNLRTTSGNQRLDLTQVCHYG